MKKNGANYHLRRLYALLVAGLFLAVTPAYAQPSTGEAATAGQARPEVFPTAAEMAPPGTPIIPAKTPLPGNASAKVSVPKHSNGLVLNVVWMGDSPHGYALLRSEQESGPWEVVADGLESGVHYYDDTLTSDTRLKSPPERVFYRVAFKDDHIKSLEDTYLKAKMAVSNAEPESADYTRLQALMGATLSSYEQALKQRATAPVMGEPDDSWFNTSRTALLLLIIIMGVLIIVFTRQARQGKEIFIRRIPGVDAIEEAVGRATEMGKPILYVPGIGEFQEIQTIASLLILGRVAEVVANYDTDIIVPCTYPIVREVADESVRQGFFQAGCPDAYKPQNVRFISSEQFAFTASTNGIILREEPAANIYLGQFFAESLILAETGFVNKSIQIAGTAETAQIPFFVTACDYTLIGEELYAVSAYLTREPRLTSSLKASDWVRLGLIAILLLGTLELAFGSSIIKDLLTFN